MAANGLSAACSPRRSPMASWCFSAGASSPSDTTTGSRSSVGISSFPSANPSPRASRACSSGLRFARLLSELLWQPMGAEFDADLAVDRLGAARAAGGICASLRDLARFGEMMRRDGMADGRQVIPSRWIDDIRNQGDAAAWQEGEGMRLLPQGRYRSKWYMTGNDHDAFRPIGIHGA